MIWLVTCKPSRHISPALTFQTYCILLLLLLLLSPSQPSLSLLHPPLRLVLLPLPLRQPHPNSLRSLFPIAPPAIYPSSSQVIPPPFTNGLAIARDFSVTTSTDICLSVMRPRSAPLLRAWIPSSHRCTDGSTPCLRPRKTITSLSPGPNSRKQFRSAGEVV